MFAVAKTYPGDSWWWMPFKTVEQKHMFFNQSICKVASPWLVYPTICGFFARISMPTNHLPPSPNLILQLLKGPPCCQTTSQSFQHDLLAVPLRNSSLKEHDVPVESAASCCWNSCCFQHWPPHRCNTTTLVFWMKEIPFDLPFSWKCVKKMK